MHSQTVDRDDFLSKFYSTPAMKCRPPIRLMKFSAKPGETWKVGTMKGGGMRIKLKAKVLDPEIVKTKTGRFRNCRKIRFTGKVSGGIDVWNSSSIESDSVVETFWYAKRVGLVKHRWKQEINIALRNGVALTVTEKMSRVLRGKKIKLSKKKKKKTNQNRARVAMKRRTTEASATRSRIRECHL